MLTHGGLFSDFFDNLRSLTVISLDLEDLGLSSRSLIWRVTRYSSHTYSTVTAYIEAFIANHSHQTLSSGQSLIWYAWLASTLAFWHYMRSGHADQHNPITTTTSAKICKGTRSSLTKNSYGDWLAQNVYQGDRIEYLRSHDNTVEPPAEWECISFCRDYVNQH